MAETKIISLEAIQNIQQLKDNIKELKKEVDTLAVGSEEYNNKVVALAENQRALKLAMTGVYDSMQDVAQASKQDADALNATVQAAQKGTATYNEMSTALGALKAQIKDIPKYLSEQDQAIGQINPVYEELNSKIKTLDTSLKGLDADNGVFSRNVGNYVGALQEWGGTMGQVQEIGSQLMSGVMGLMGVMSMFGADTEDTKESLATLVPIITLLNSAKGIGGLAKLLPTAAAGQKVLAAATVASTAANTANATAAGAATVATEAETVAQDTLNKTMLANPILAIVAGLTALVGVVAKYVSNVNKAAKETKAFEKQQEELNKKFEEQNKEFEREQKLKQAQGVSNQVLLAQKKENIRIQRAETEELRNNIQARINQMKADSAWVRFWKGENKQIKNLEEQLKGLNAQIKGFDNSLKDIDTDIQVDTINKGKEAAKKYSDTLKNDVKNAVNVANEAIKSQRTELEQLNAEYEKNIKTLNSGLTGVEQVMKKAKVGSKEWLQAQNDMNTIQSGLTANLERYNKAMLDYKNRAETKQLAKDLKEIQEYLNRTTDSQQALERLMNTVLGYNDAQKIMYQITKDNGDVVPAASKETQMLVETYKRLNGVIENDIRSIAKFSGEMKDFTFSGLDMETLVRLSKTDAERLVANVGEPLATAITEWAKNNDSLKEASFKALSEAFAQGKTMLEEALSKGDIEGAKVIEAQIMAMIRGNYPCNNPDLQNEINLLGQALNQQIVNAIAGDEYSLNFAEKFDALLNTEGVKTKFDAIMRITNDFNSTFVASTADALSSVAGLWENMLKQKYKQLVESGKMTEEEAEEQAMAEFENIKALQIGVAAIDTAAAIVQALADPTVPSYYVKAANAIAAGVAGAAQIIQISMQEFGKPSVNSNSSVSTPTYTEEPQGMYYSVGINPMDYAEANSKNPVRAYVVDKDLVEGIDYYNNRETETTF